MVSGEARVPLFSSLLLLCSPPRPPDAPRHTHTHPSQGERPAAAPDLLHFASALGERGRRSASTSGRWPGRAGQVAASQAGRGAVRTASRGAELARPQSLLARRLGPNWLAASGKRDLGQNGWHLHSIKNRFRMDSGSPQSEAARGAGSAAARPRGRGPGRRSTLGDARRRPLAGPRAARVGPPPRAGVAPRPVKACAPVRVYPWVRSCFLVPLAFGKTGKPPRGAASSDRRGSNHPAAALRPGLGSRREPYLPCLGTQPLACWGEVTSALSARCRVPASAWLSLKEPALIKSQPSKGWKWAGGREGGKRGQNHRCGPTLTARGGAGGSLGSSDPLILVAARKDVSIPG